MIVLSSPYSSSDKEVVKNRVKETGEYVVSLMKQGKTVVSPTLYGLSVIDYSQQNLPTSFQFWEKYCKDIIMASNEVFVANIEGWQESNGVKGEIEYAKEFGKNVWLVEKRGDKVFKTGIINAINSCHEIDGYGDYYLTLGNYSPHNLLYSLNLKTSDINEDLMNLLNGNGINLDIEDILDPESYMTITNYNTEDYKEILYNGGITLSIKNKRLIADIKQLYNRI